MHLPQNRLISDLSLALNRQEVEVFDPEIDLGLELGVLLDLDLAEVEVGADDLGLGRVSEL